MSSLGTSNDFNIVRLRVKGSKLDPLAVRPRVQNLISEIRLHPLLPESASLFIRKLDDPSPGLLQLEAIDSRATQTWRRSFHAKFAQLATSAVRPARGPVSSSAESVVFLDYSELLACLTADWCNGFVGARWWWHSFLKRGDIEQVIKQFWREKIEYVPAALQQLAKTHVLVEFVSTLSERETRDLVERLADRFALPALRHVVDSFHQHLAEAPEMSDDVSGASAAVVTKEAQLRSIAPWKHVVPESDTARLRPAQQLFLGVGLMIKRAPAQVRTRSFAREVERWQLLALSGSSAVVVDEIQTAPDVVEEAKVAIVVPPPVSVDSGNVAEERVDTDETDPGRIEIVSVDVARTEPSRLVSVGVEEAIPAGSEPHRVVESSPETRVNNEPSVDETPPAAEIVPQLFAELEESFTIETHLGGFFYLINLGIFLNLYADFTSPAETFAEVNIWDFVALVGSELNEHQNDDDPIWSLLANLAGRDPGTYEEFLHEETPIWLSRLMPDIRLRLRRALNTDDFAKVVCRHRARVTVTATHLGVFFALAELPIEIRLAGLDRDPGWVPAAGRFIAFHFE